jgi:hypothetical protein
MKYEANYSYNRLLRYINCSTAQLSTRSEKTNKCQNFFVLTFFINHFYHFPKPKFFSLQISLALFITLFSFTNKLQSEGTKELMPLSANFGCLQFNDQGRTFALMTNTDSLHRLFFHIKTTTEKVYFGFARHATSTATSGQFRIKDPSGNIVFAATNLPTSGTGFISTFIQAAAGPKIGASPAAGYTPFSFTPATTGDFYIEFSSNSNGNYRFLYFDLTVVSALNVPITGRLWSYAWDMNTWAAANVFNGIFYVYTNEGYVSKVDLNGIQPFGFVVSCNDTGPTNTNDIVQDRKSIAGNSTRPLFKIFVNDPDPAIYLSATPPTLSGSITVVGGNIYYGQSVQFSATIKGTGTIQVIISINGISGYQSGTADVIVALNVITGTNIIPWDGKNAFGVFPVSGTSIEISTGFSSGITHLPIYDAETQLGGYNVTRIRPVTGPAPIRWDDSNFSGGTLNISGSSGNGHSWAVNFGDVRTVNTWWNGYEIENLNAFTVVVIDPMPITLTSFTAKANDNVADIFWTVASQTNNDFFTIERTNTVNGGIIKPVGIVMGAGICSQSKDYSFTDESPLKGISYYRLKQTDFDGRVTYYNWAAVEIKSTAEFSINVYPNPNKNEPINLLMNADKDQEVLVVVYDILGNESYSKVILIENVGESVYVLDPSKKLEPGAYSIVATSMKKICCKKLIVKEY